jgi:V-type H+-transporting ATPase subunit D
MNLTLTKQRLKGAQTGHSLLAKKRDALMNRFRAILRKVDEVSVDLLEDTPRSILLIRVIPQQAKRLMGRVLQLASFSLAEVTYATGGEIGFQVQESVRQASYTVRAKSENVSGVMLPAFEGVRSKEGNGTSDS